MDETLEIRCIQSQDIKESRKVGIKYEIKTQYFEFNSVLDVGKYGKQELFCPFCRKTLFLEVFPGIDVMSAFRSFFTDENGNYRFIMIILGLIGLIMLILSFILLVIKPRISLLAILPSFFMVRAFIREINYNTDPKILINNDTRHSIKCREYLLNETDKSREFRLRTRVPFYQGHSDD